MKVKFYTTLREIAERFEEVEVLERMGEITYLNYLRIYHNVDVWPCDD